MMTASAMRHLNFDVLLKLLWMKRPKREMSLPEEKALQVWKAGTSEHVTLQDWEGGPGHV